MTEEEKYLQKARIALKDVAAARARREWRTKRADPEALAARVLTQELINTGDLQILKSVAKYLGTFLPSESTVKLLPPGTIAASIGSPDKQHKIIVYVEKTEEDQGFTTTCF